MIRVLEVVGELIGPMPPGHEMRVRVVDLTCEEDGIGLNLCGIMSHDEDQESEFMLAIQRRILSRCWTG